jgi:hypothetical protein
MSSGTATTAANAFADNATTEAALALADRSLVRSTEAGADSGGRDQRRQSDDRFHRREAKLGAAVGLRLAEAIDDLALRQLFQPL